MPVAIVLLIVTGVLYGGVFFNKSNKQTALNNSAVAVQATKPKLPQVMPRAEPSQLSIPSIAVNTSLIQTGRQADGTLQMPDRYDIAAWYHDSPAPGERGPAVIVGHVDNYRGIGVFWRLHELQPSDIIEVSRVDGTVAKFSVTAVKEYPQNNFPTKEIYGNLDYAGIRLITCGGPFDYQAHEYTDNIVVYGKLNPSS